MRIEKSHENRRCANETGALMADGSPGDCIPESGYRAVGVAKCLRNEVCVVVPVVHYDPKLGMKSIAGRERLPKSWLRCAARSVRWITSRTFVMKRWQHGVTIQDKIQLRKRNLLTPTQSVRLDFVVAIWQCGENVQSVLKWLQRFVAQ